MKRPLQQDSTRSTLNLALPLHSIAEEIADLMKPCHPAKPWGPREFFIGIGYHTHNLEGNVLSPESLVIPSYPPPTERIVEDQSFCLEHKHPDGPCEQVNITSGLFSLHASQLKEHKALALASKTAAAFSNALSIAEYVYNQPEISEESRVGLHHLKLDLVAGTNFA